MRTRTHARILLGTLLAILALSAACKKPAPQAPPPPPPPPPAAPPSPTVNLQADPATIQSGGSSTLRWSSTNATNLNLSGIGPVSADGNQQVTPQSTTTYTLTATGPGGSATGTATITVNQPPPPKPAAHVPTMQELFDAAVKDAFFEYDKADVRPDARDALSQTAQFLRSYPQVKVVIEGHCDERGSTEYNLALGDRRAAAAKQFLISLGISTDRIETVSYGKERPFCSASTEDCWQQNRRAHIVMGK